MTVNAVETLTGFVAALGTGSPVITTSLVPTDRVVVLVLKDGTSGTPLVSGLGATWSNLFIETSVRDFYVISTTGVTGGGTLTINGFTSSGDYIVMVLRSTLPGVTPSFLGYLNPSWMLISVGPGTVKTSGALQVPAGSFVVGVGNAAAGTATAPTTSSQPAAGSWTAVYANSAGGAKTAKWQPTVDSVAEMSVSATGSGALGACVMAFSDQAFTGTPPSYVAERQTVSLPSSSSTPVTLATSLLASDVILVVMYALFTATPTVTAPALTFQVGFGATSTWRLNSWRHWAFYAAGASGSTTVTIANPGGSAVGATVYVLRGLNSAVLAETVSSTYGSSATTGRSVAAGSDVGLDQIAILSFLEEASVPTTFPSAVTPASGWQSPDSIGDMQSIVHEDIASAGPMSGAFTISSTGGYGGISLLVFGTPSTPPPPSSGDFAGWGVPM